MSYLLLDGRRNIQLSIPQYNTFTLESEKHKNIIGSPVNTITSANLPAFVLRTKMSKTKKLKTH